MLKKYCLAIILFSLIIVNANYAAAEILFGRTYQQKLHQYLNQAKTKITLAMYFIIPEPSQSGPINELVNDLINAKKRGVTVKVILEDSKLKENRPAYEKLRANQIEVYFDTPANLLHIKGVAIDNRYTFIGSANWSKAAITNNHEATVFSDSETDALAFERYIAGIALQNKDILLPVTEGAGIFADFLLNIKSGRQLLKNQADAQFDLYLLLSKIAQETGQNTFAIDYDYLAKTLGYTALTELGKYRNQHHYFYERLHHSLKRLRRYGLITYTNKTVTLNNQPTQQKIIIPAKYWQDDYPHKLSLRAKYLYLICLHESSRSKKYPFWFRSQTDLAKIYGISDTTISLGLQELEQQGIIAITRDKLNPADFSDRKANVYQML